MNMQKRIQRLQPKMAVRVAELLEIANSKGLELLVYCGVRSVEEQNVLYRQSRKATKIIQHAQFLTNVYGERFGRALIDVGPQGPGPHVTNAAGGESWHNYGYAIDAVPVRHGKLVWDDKDPLWQLYGECVKEAGLFWAGDWKRFKEYPHAQYYEKGPRHVFSQEELSALAIWE